jgi:hypothetical protein
VRELAQLPVRVGRAKTLFDGEEGGQLTRIRRRGRVEFVRVYGDPHAVPVLQLQSVCGRQRGKRAEVISARRRTDLVDVAHVAPFGQGSVMFVERGERGLPVLAGGRPPQRRRRGAHRGGEESAGRDVGRELGDHGPAGRKVHQHSQYQHRVVNLSAGHRGEVSNRTGSHDDAILHLGPLGAQRGLEDGAHLRVGLDRKDLVAGPGQPDGLRPLPRAHVKDSRRRLRQVLVQLAGDQLLPDRVAHVAQMVQPARPAVTERVVSHRAPLDRA